MAHAGDGYGAMKKPSADPHLLASLRRIGAKPPEIIELLDYVENLLVWVKDAEGHYQWVNMAFLLNLASPAALISSAALILIFAAQLWPTSIASTTSGCCKVSAFFPAWN